MQIIWCEVILVEVYISYSSYLNALRSSLETNGRFSEFTGFSWYQNSKYVDTFTSDSWINLMVSSWINEARCHVNVLFSSFSAGVWEQCASSVDLLQQYASWRRSVVAQRDVRVRVTWRLNAAHESGGQDRSIGNYGFNGIFETYWDDWQTSGQISDIRYQRRLPLTGWCTLFFLKEKISSGLLLLAIELSSRSHTLTLKDPTL